MKLVHSFLLLLFFTASAHASRIFIPMDVAQKNHLKAYGITYWTLKQNVEADWLLNYRGGSFSMPYAKAIEDECKIRGISYEVIADGQYTSILSEIANPEANMDVVKLDRKSVV